MQGDNTESKNDGRGENIGGQAACVERGANMAGVTKDTDKYPKYDLAASRMDKIYGYIENTIRS